jgi:NAD(P)H-dependent FMN reductase
MSQAVASFRRNSFNRKLANAMVKLAHDVVQRNQSGGREIMAWDVLTELEAKES